VLLWTFKNAVVLDGQVERDNIESLKNSMVSSVDLDGSACGAPRQQEGADVPVFV
jgi:hypothetical protein